MAPPSSRPCPPPRPRPRPAARLTAQAISRRRPRASRPERGSGEQQPQPDRREREGLPAGLGQPARGPAADSRLGRGGLRIWLAGRLLLAVRLLLGRLLLAARRGRRLVLGRLGGHRCRDGGP